ncbi:MAG TPA: cystathionine beta-lyase [Alphaproteobacteria bacterium]|nr:cystathionine beta-lyase [Alphaproteobacteria bacterium]
MKDKTRIITLGRDTEAFQGAVNPPVYHASTILFPTYKALRSANPFQTDKPYYGRRGTQTTWAFTKAVAELEGGAHAWAFPSGLAAVNCALSSFLNQGDHVLITDSTYYPTRVIADQILKPKGVESSYYDPDIGAGIAALIKPNTKVIYLESPGSLTFEIQDIPAIAAEAHKAGATVILDNTWASPLFLKPFELGVDVSVQAATKYIVGHSDAMLGVVTTTEEKWVTLRNGAGFTGQCAGPDDIYLGLRGLRTLDARLRQHQTGAIALAEWLEGRPEIDKVLHPALPSHPRHDIWKRDFLGASGLFGVVFKKVTEPAIEAMLDSLEHFGMGYSWGGFESLALPAWPSKIRTATKWTLPEPILRIHVGLEDIDDLIADLEQGFEKFNAAL